MKRRIALWATAGVVATVLLLTACTTTPGIKAVPVVSEPARQPEALPDRQQVTLSLPMDPGGLDPAHATEEEAFAILGNVMEGLVRPGPGGVLQPGVAAEWTVSEGVHYTFRLRPGATWSDGRPVTAHDFQFAWLRALDPRSGAMYAYQLYHIRGAEAFNTLNPAAPDFDELYKLRRAQVAIEAPDDHTLEVTLEQPAAHWLALTAFPAYYPVREDVITRHGLQFGREPEAMVYNGPFVLAWWESGQKLILHRNPHYWDAASVRLEQVQFDVITQPAIPVRRYDAGELDRVEVPPSRLLDYHKDPHLSRTAGAATWYLAVNVRQNQLRRSDLRRILHLVLDRRELTEKALPGLVMGAEGLVPPSISSGGRPFREVAGTLVPPGRDLPAAEQLWLAYLKDTGRDSLPLRLTAPDSARAREVTAALKERLEKALPGLSLTVSHLEPRTLLERLRDGDFDLAFSGTGADYNDPLTFLELWLSDSTLNDSGWANADFDALVRKARTAPAGDDRTKLLADAEAILLRDLPVIPLYHPVTYRLTRPWLKGILDHPFGPTPDLKGAYIEGRTK